MTQLERKGRRIVLAIGLIVCLPPLIGLGVRMVKGAPVGISDWWGQFALPAVLCCFVYLGHKWARVAAVILFGLVTSATILMIFFLGGPRPVQLTLAYFSVLFGTSATVLWASRAVDAYMDGRNPRPSTSLRPEGS